MCSFAAPCAFPRRLHIAVLPHRDALYVAPISLIAPISPRESLHIVRQDGLALVAFDHSGPDPAPARDASNSEPSWSSCQAWLSGGRSRQHARPPAERRPSGIPLNTAMPKSPRQLLRTRPISRPDRLRAGRSRDCGSRTTPHPTGNKHPEPFQ